MKERLPSISSDMPPALQNVISTQVAYEASKVRSGGGRGVIMRDTERTPALHEAYLGALKIAVADPKAVEYLKAYADLRTQRGLPTADTPTVDRKADITAPAANNNIRVAQAAEKVAKPLASVTGGDNTNEPDGNRANVAEVAISDQKKQSQR